MDPSNWVWNLKHISWWCNLIRTEDWTLFFCLFFYGASKRHLLTFFHRRTLNCHLKRASVVRLDFIIGNIFSCPLQRGAVTEDAVQTHNCLLFILRHAMTMATVVVLRSWWHTLSHSPTIRNTLPCLVYAGQMMTLYLYVYKQLGFN